MYSVIYTKNLKPESLLACSAKASFLKELLSVAYSAMAFFDNVLFTILRMAWLCVHVHMVMQTSTCLSSGSLQTTASLQETGCRQAPG